MWPIHQDAGPGMAYVEQGITQSHPLPCDILCAYDWDLIEPLDCVEGLEPLAWEHSPSDLPALSSAHLPEPLAWEHSPSDLPALSSAHLPENAVCSGGITRSETTDNQDQADPVPARRKQDSNAQAQRKSRQKKKVCFT